MGTRSPLALPALEPDEGFSDDEFNDETAAVYYMKRSKFKFSVSAFSKQKFHVLDSVLPGLLACRKYSLTDCELIGPDLPDSSMLCKSCKRARPELF